MSEEIRYHSQKRVLRTSLIIGLIVGIILGVLVVLGSVHILGIDKLFEKIPSDFLVKVLEIGGFPAFVAALYFLFISATGVYIFRRLEKRHE